MISSPDDLESRIIESDITAANDVENMTPLQITFCLLTKEFWDVSLQIYSKCYNIKRAKNQPKKNLLQFIQCWALTILLENDQNAKTNSKADHYSKHIELLRQTDSDIDITQIPSQSQFLCFATTMVPTQEDMKALTNIFNTNSFKNIQFGTFTNLGFDESIYDFNARLSKMLRSDVETQISNTEPPVKQTKTTDTAPTDHVRFYHSLCSIIRNRSSGGLILNKLVHLLLQSYKARSMLVFNPSLWV